MSDEYAVPAVLLDLREQRRKLTSSEMAREYPPNLLYMRCAAVADGDEGVTRALYLHAMFEAGFIGERPEPDFAPYAVCPVCGYDFSAPVDGPMVAGQKHTVAVDFDGVLHSYTSKWVSPEHIPDPPIPGAVEWLNEIVGSFNVVIFTTRGKTAAGREAVRSWLHRYGVVWAHEAWVTAVKPPALVYLDDRGMRFEGRFPSAAEVHAARPWKVAP